MTRAAVTLPLLSLLALAAPLAAQTRHDTSAPIDFGADQIELQDKANRAVLSGNVAVKQAEMTLNAARMTVAYTGQVVGGNPQVSRLDASASFSVLNSCGSSCGRRGSRCGSEAKRDRTCAAPAQAPASAVAASPPMPASSTRARAHPPSLADASAPAWAADSTRAATGAGAAPVRRERHHQPPAASAITGNPIQANVDIRPLHSLRAPAPGAMVATAVPARGRAGARDGQPWASA